MAYVAACLRGKMGNTEFFTVKMKAGESTRALRRAQETDDWAQMGIEERLQRELACTRVYREIAPYIANYEDRFFGSLIVLVYKGEVFFESIKNFKAEIPRAYQAQAEDMGFLTIDGGELIVLDGQHRLEGLRYAINGRGKMSETGREGPIEGEFVGAPVANDEVTLIVVKHQSYEKTRRIFNRVNRYAKPVSAGDNIITSEDDAVAILARQMLDRDAPLGKQYRGDAIVNWRSNTLPERSTKFTTISALYETITSILNSHESFRRFVDKNPSSPPRAKDILEAYEVVSEIWQQVIDGLVAYRDAVRDPSLIPEMRKPESTFSLLFKPAAQVSLFEALMRSHSISKLSYKNLLDRIERIGWSMRDPIWLNIVVKADGTINAQKEARERTVSLITYLAVGDKMNPTQLAQAKLQFNSAHGHQPEIEEGQKLSVLAQAHRVPLQLPSRPQ